jgi:hypothetical protein
MTPEEKQARALGHGLVNVSLIWSASAKAGLPFYAACALMEKESGGRNVYGHDAGGALSGYPHPVTFDNWRVFRWLVIDKGMTSNGVGPAQITWKPFFLRMEDELLKPWSPFDNMFFGFRLIRDYRVGKTWADAGTRYNGSPDYGRDYAAKVETWRLMMNP